MGALGGETRRPDLLFNGQCDSATYFQASFAGQDFGLIALLGAAQSFPIENVSASAAFNFANRVGSDNAFRRTAPALSNSTYAVLRTGSPGSAAVRALFTFQTSEDCENSWKACNIL